VGRRLRVPGSRDVRAILDRRDSPAVVVACPPHPGMGGDRSDPRLRAVSDALGERGVDCLRVDCGPWDGGRGERTGVRSALGWARGNYARVGLFGYSLGASVALLAAAAAFRDGEDTPEAVSALAPAASIEGFDVAPAVDTVRCPLQVVYGERDGTVDPEPVAERARQHGGTVETLGADHFFLGQQQRIGALAAAFLPGRP